jgi:hypothetical protein
MAFGNTSPCDATVQSVSKSFLFDTRAQLPSYHLAIEVDEGVTKVFGMLFGRLNS